MATSAGVGRLGGATHPAEAFGTKTSRERGSVDAHIIASSPPQSAIRASPAPLKHAQYFCHLRFRSRLTVEQRVCTCTPMMQSRTVRGAWRVFTSRLQAVAALTALGKPLSAANIARMLSASRAAKINLHLHRRGSATVRPIASATAALSKEGRRGAPNLSARIPWRSRPRLWLRCCT